MLRLTLVLLALSGCDIVLGLDSIQDLATVCGPFESVRPVPIVGVTEPSQFSISADEQLALVIGLDAQQRRRPIPLQWNGEAWQPYASYQMGLDSQGIVGARLAPAEPTPMNNAYTGPVQPVMNAWTVNSGRHQVNRYYWSGTTWTVDTNQPGLFEGAEYDVHAGNVVVVANTVDTNRVRHTVVTWVAVETDASNQILLYANNLPSYSLTRKDRTLALNEQAKVSNVVLGDAVLTQNQAKLVYAAVSGGQSDIHASEQSSLREFATGGELEGVTTLDDEVEPWIDATCSKLYFRRIPAGSPNAAGEILVAE